MASGCQSNTSLCSDVGKDAWPELCGVLGRTAAATIRKENPSVKPRILLEGTPVTRDIRCDRVRVWVNEAGNVTTVPVVG
ncbi:hypothetical protein LguiA_002489 [Lonicera macranthoides]